MYTGKAKYSQGERRGKNDEVACMFGGDIGVKKWERELFWRDLEDLCHQRVAPQGRKQQGRKGKGLWVILYPSIRGMHTVDNELGIFVYLQYVLGLGCVPDFCLCLCLPLPTFSRHLWFYKPPYCEFVDIQKWLWNDAVGNLESHITVANQRYYCSEFSNNSISVLLYQVVCVSGCTVPGLVFQGLMSALSRTPFLTM